MSFDLTPLFESGGTFQQIGYYSFPSITEGVSIDQLPCHLTTYKIHIKLHLRHVLHISKRTGSMVSSLNVNPLLVAISFP